VTVLIGFAFPDLAVLGADSRGTAADDPSDVADDVEKINKTSLGLIAEAGRSDVTEVVRRWFANHTPTSSDEATEAIRAAVAALPLADDDPGLVTACWLATFATAPNGCPQSHLALINRDGDYEFRVVRHGDFFLVKPTGLSDEISRNLDAAARRRFEQYVRDAPAEKRVQMCASMIGGLVKTVAQHTNSVSQQWSVGYHDATNNLVRVSAVGSDPDALTWR
jgi:hypothetical protein